jgi:predicted ATP-grasp superfamily ATP-dependent carboligase
MKEVETLTILNQYVGNDVVIGNDSFYVEYLYDYTIL